MRGTSTTLVCRKAACAGFLTSHLDHERLLNKIRIFKLIVG